MPREYIPSIPAKTLGLLSERELSVELEGVPQIPDWLQQKIATKDNLTEEEEELASAAIAAARREINLREHTRKATQRSSRAPRRRPVASPQASSCRSDHAAYLEKA